jgi:hypothetical protein
MKRLALMLLVSIGAASAAHGQVPTVADFAACNDEAPTVARAGAVSPTTADRTRAKDARAGSATTGAGDFKPPSLIESSDPQIHGMSVDGARDAAYQAAYRACMRRRGF